MFREISEIIHKGLSKSPFSSGTNTPVSRSRANSIDLDSSFDMLSIQERMQNLEQLLLETGFMNNRANRPIRREHIKITSVLPIKKY